MRQAQRGVTLFLNAFAFSSSVVIHRVRQQTLAFEVVLNANTVLCHQQPCNNASSYSVTGTSHRSHECTMTTAQRSTWKEHSRKPLNAAATCNLKKKKPQTEKAKLGGRGWKGSKSVFLIAMEEKLQLDLRLPDLTWQNDRLFCQETVKYDRGKPHQCASKQRKEGHDKSVWNTSRSGNSLWLITRCVICEMLSMT